MLRLKFYQIENVVVMKVLEQDRRNINFTYKGLTLESIDHPEIREGDFIYLRGDEEKKDNNLACHDFETNEAAKKFIDCAMEVVRAYNKEYSQIKDEPEIKIQEFIAE